MSLQTKEDFEYHMNSIGLGIQGLELRRYSGEKNSLQLKSLRKYLCETERYILPESMKTEEKSLNSDFGKLKRNMDRKRYSKALLRVSRIHIQLEKIYNTL